MWGWTKWNYCCSTGHRGQHEERADTQGTERRDKETESGSCGLNLAVCLAVPEEWVLHQLQLGRKGLMDKTAQQGSRVRRPLSARANWSVRTEFKPTFYGEIHTHVWSCFDRRVFHQSPYLKNVLCCACTVMEISLGCNNHYLSLYIATSTTYSSSYVGQLKT